MACVSPSLQMVHHKPLTTTAYRCTCHEQHLVPKGTEAALGLIGLVQDMYAASVGADEQLLRAHTVACAAEGEAMQLHLHLLEETELFEGKHAGQADWQQLRGAINGRGGTMS